MKEKNPEKKFSPPFFFWLLVLFLILGIGFFYFQISQKTSPEELKTKIIPEAVKKIVNDPQITITVANLKEKSGVYEFELSLDSGGGNPNKYISYITKDGKILFQSGRNLETLLAATPRPTEKKIGCQDIQKEVKPSLTAFVVANCPFGLQMQRIFKIVRKETPGLAEALKIKYLGSVENGKITSMHGEKEAEENLRQICLREEQTGKLWDYLACYMEEGKASDCLKRAKIDVGKLTSCLNDKNRGLKYAQEDFTLANQFNINGSPTLLINDKQLVSEFNFGGRTPEAIKEILCCSFEKKPADCEKTLSKETVATSFSLEDKVQGANTSAASCGN